MTSRVAGPCAIHTAIAILALAVRPQLLAMQAPVAPPPTAAHLVVPFLANATTRNDIEFEGADCQVDSSHATMDCTFQQVFLTTSPGVQDTCLVTTNRYDRTFRRDTPTRWVSTTTPSGACGVREITTLQDDGGVRWTMELRKVATRGDAAGCRVDEPVTFSWQNVRRPLPCRFVQPGGLGQLVDPAPRRRQRSPER